MHISGADVAGGEDGVVKRPDRRSGQLRVCPRVIIIRGAGKVRDQSGRQRGPVAGKLQSDVIGRLRLALRRSHVITRNHVLCLHCIGTGFECS